MQAASGAVRHFASTLHSAIEIPSLVDRLSLNEVRFIAGLDMTALRALLEADRLRAPLMAYGRSRGKERSSAKRAVTR